MPSFRKIIGAVSEINSLHTSIHSDKGDLIEPVAFAGSIYNEPGCVLTKPEEIDGEAVAGDS